MILLVHMLLGAAIGSSINNIYLAIILSFLSHYLLDLIPHFDYPLKYSAGKKILIIPNILRIGLDFFSGILLIFLFSKNHPLIYICAIVAIIPDGLTVLNDIIPSKILELHRKLHIDKIQILTNGPDVISGKIKISNFWRISVQILVVLISIYILKT